MFFSWMCLRWGSPRWLCHSRIEGCNNIEPFVHNRDCIRLGHAELTSRDSRDAAYHAHLGINTKSIAISSCPIQFQVLCVLTHSPYSLLFLRFAIHDLRIQRSEGGFLEDWLTGRDEACCRGISPLGSGENRNLGTVLPWSLTNSWTGDVLSIAYGHGGLRGLRHPVSTIDKISVINYFSRRQTVHEMIAGHFPQVFVGCTICKTSSQMWHTGYPDLLFPISDRAC
jgi:hypothetical protein